MVTVVMGVTAIILMLTLVSFIFPYLLIFAVIGLVVFIVCAIFQNKENKRQRAIIEETNRRLKDLDVSSYETFAASLKELIIFCVENKYKFPLTDTTGHTFTFKQSIDKLGIQDMRDIFGTKAVLHRVLVTNGDITSQARKFCNSAYITVLNRENLVEMFFFKISKEGE